jgi:hypothetical protein
MLVGCAVVLNTKCTMMVSAFANPSSHQPFGVASVHRPSPFQSSLITRSNLNQSPQTSLFMTEDKFEKIDEDDDQIIAFMDLNGEKAIDCYVDSYATVDQVEYTIGSPCDYAVALCYFENDEQLVPIELDDPLMDDIFPVAEGIIEDEFGEELVLLRTPQTLTLVGVSFVVYLQFFLRLMPTLVTNALSTTHHISRTLG